MDSHVHADKINMDSHVHADKYGHASTCLSESGDNYDSHACTAPKVRLGITYTTLCHDDI